jgi:hypothetical protein
MFQDVRAFDDHRVRGRCRTLDTYGRHTELLSRDPIEEEVRPT